MSFAGEPGEPEGQDLFASYVGAALTS
jgi:hypothetical protein